MEYTLDNSRKKLKELENSVKKKVFKKKWQAIKKDKFDIWLKENKLELENWWNKEKQKYFSLTEEDLKDLWNQNKCFYCGCTGKEFIKFKENRPSKRYSKRGNNFEVDRKINFSKENELDFGPYSKDNTVLSCYWCNNAKSDVFDEVDFEEIGKVIGNTIKNIISK